MKAASLSRLKSVVVVAAVLILGVGLGRWWQQHGGGPAPSPLPQTPSTATPRSGELPSLVTFDKIRQTAAGIKTAPVQYESTNETIVVTGKIAVNEDRLAHIASMVEGVLREVHVSLGSDVVAGQLLAVVDSKEVGAAKLELVKNRMNVEFARTNHQWAETIHKNTQALIAALAASPTIADLETRFRDQPMGDNRQLLVSSYAKYRQTKADFERLSTLREQQVGVEKDYIRAKADFESAEATYQALLEQLKFTTKQRLLEANQKLQESVTAERMSRASLLILGYTEREIDKMDPLAEGEAVAHYPIRAPFDGTVIGKHAVLSEHVGPLHQLFELADLSRVWLQADVFEKDLAALGRPAGKAIRFQAAGYHDRTFTAQIVHTGSLVDEKTRAVRMIGMADNGERLLKPGMFVEVSISLGAPTKSLQVPAAAVQSQGGDSYVFVAHGPEEFERRVIQLGRTTGTNVEVLNGLKPEELVVVEGAFALKSEMLKELLAE